jgi:hypothetical protein
LPSPSRSWAPRPSLCWLMLLAWPIVWNHYLVLTIPWVVLSLRGAMADGKPRRTIVVGVVAVALMMGFPPGLSTIDHASGLQVALGYQLPTIALLAAVALGFNRDREPAGGAR